MRAENHFSGIEQKRILTGWEKYQKEWNFIETDYSERPSNNGLDLGNPGFAFDKHLARYVKFDA